MKARSGSKSLKLLIPAFVLIMSVFTLSFGSTSMFGKSSDFSHAETSNEKDEAAVSEGYALTDTKGISLIRIEPGSFVMGSDNEGTWDESPARKVTISQPFSISKDLVTVDQFRQFRSETGYNEDHFPYITGISWYDAVEFCKWLTEKEGVPYRLPTEAEWEYVASQFAGSTGGKENRVENMPGDTILEWCHDWYGEYPEEDSVDPAGPLNGHSRVVRGGPLDRDSYFWSAERIVESDPLNRDSRDDFVTPSNRSSMAPGFKHYTFDKYNSFGQHNIGFRVVQAPFPQTEYYDNEPHYPMLGIKQTNRHLEASPDPEKPYFRKRYILPAPPETRFYSDRESIDAAGLHPGIRQHNHSPALVVCNNGDLLYLVYSSYDEYEAGVLLIGSRLRFGAEEWDMPDLHTGFAGANNSTPLLWNENGRLYLFFGSNGIDNAYPFQYKISDDNGATWSEVMFPYIKNDAKMGDWRRQPVSTVVRDLEGTMYVPTDGEKYTILWATDDNGQTWYNTSGQAYGRHTQYALLKDGGILGVGGKSTDINGFMPKSISYDKGKTWIVTKTPFPSQYGRNRPSLLRLKSGRLFMTGDFHSRYEDKNPEGTPDWGCYVALSEDEGQTWHTKLLYGAGKHRWEGKYLGDSARVTVGYSVTRQGNDGLIHIATSINRHAMHFAMNEAWIMDMDADETDDSVLMASSASSITDVSEYSEYYPDGQVRICWNGGVADDGRFLLHGTETWYYENGQKQREASYELGNKTGTETFWLRNGNKKWQWEYDTGGRDKWTQWWPDGQKKSISHWLNFKADGHALRWDRSGNVISEVLFKDGEIQ